jgi:hypothetical protein
MNQIKKLSRAEFSKKLEGKMLKLLLWPACRAYARHLGDRPADAIYRFLCSLQFWSVYRFWPDLARPRLFSEKLWNRMLHVRDPLFTLICDKYRVREYIAKKVGGECLIPLLWSGKEPDDIPFDNLPDQFVIKANHGSGYNIIVTDKTKLRRASVKQGLRRWLDENFALDKFLGAAWGYKNIDPHITIESFIGDQGKPPVDYKFYCFSGRIEVLTLHFGRFERHETKAFDRNFNPLDASRSFRQYEGEYGQPQNYDAMVNLAESIAEDFDFIRVDLYSSGSRVFFGELTPYPAGASSFHGLDMTIFDMILGEKWKLGR